MKFTICLDITFIDGYVKNFVNKSKTNQHRQENEIPISEGVSSVCPEKMLQRYILVIFCQSTIYNNKKNLVTNEQESAYYKNWNPLYETLTLVYIPCDQKMLKQQRERVILGRNTEDGHQIRL